MFKKIKWHINRIWRGPGTIIHGSSQSDWTLLIPNDGGLERKLNNFVKKLRQHIKKFSIWIIAAIILATIGFFVPYLLNKWFN